jgi:hypothetical protein
MTYLFLMLPMRCGILTVFLCKFRLRITFCMLLTADPFELIATNLPRVLVIAMVAIFLFTFFVELIKNDLLVMQIYKSASN